ncbi:MAG: hypothetical protein BYD32DRAFT_460275 [Podila humilis]|nr:MAG: hypothetical protein BYD32DRAFT_460275 [Podila humilis]
MGQFERTEPPVSQKFKRSTDNESQRLPTQVCPETGRSCIFWQDVEKIYPGVEYVYRRQPWSGEKRILFMVDQCGEVLCPPRIPFTFNATYRVIFRKPQEQPPVAAELQSFYRSWKDVFKTMEQTVHSESRDVFLEISGNVGYYHSKFMNQLKQMKEVGIKAEVDGYTEDQIMDEMKKCHQKFLVWEDENAFMDILCRQDFLAPCRFLVLPADLGSWVDSDPTTHHFRLYFLCDVISNESKKSGLSKHKHLSNHSGYNLCRPHEFFQAFGSLTLLMLKMFKHGVSNKTLPSKILPLDTFEILWSIDPDVTRNHITKDTIRPLVQKSISYLQAMHLPKCGHQVQLVRESRTIKDFLVVPKGSNALGALFRCPYRTNSWHWICQQHARQYITSDTLEVLADFVQGCRGHIDYQQASLSIELKSRRQARQLCTLLKNTEQVIDISIRLSWKVSRQDLKALLYKIAHTKVHHLGLDGVTLGIHPQGTAEYRTDLFDDRIFAMGSLKSVTLLNYPRPQQQYTYFSSLWSSVRLFWKQQQQVETGNWWSDLAYQTDDYVDAISNFSQEKLLQVSRCLQDLLAKAGYQTVSKISLRRKDWHGEFDMENGTLQALQVFHFTALEEDRDCSLGNQPVSLQALGSLRILTVDADFPEVDRDLVRWVEACPQLQELNISVQESHALARAEIIFDMRQDQSHPIQLTLLERDTDGRGHAIAKVIIRDQATDHLESTSTGLQGSVAYPVTSQKWRQSVLTKIKFLDWKCDHFSTPLTDLTAILLEKAIKLNPWATTSLSLDISRLRQEHLPYVQNILQQSKLGHLRICCTAFDPSQANFVRQVLFSIQWLTLQSLVVSGTTINDWIQLLAVINREESTASASLLEMQLFGLRIEGSTKEPVFLSHSSVLFVHQLVYSNPWIELVLENVCLQDKRDSDLLAESLRS